MRGSVFFRRTLALVLSGVLLTSILSAALYIVIVRNQFVHIRGDELTLVARSISDVIASEDDTKSLETGFIFKAIANENTNFVDATIYALNTDGLLTVYSTGATPNFPSGHFGSDFSGPPQGRPNPPDSSAYDIGKDSAIVDDVTDSAAQEGTDSAEASEEDIHHDPRNPDIGKPVTLSIITETFDSVKAGNEVVRTATSEEDGVLYLLVGVPIYDVEDGSFRGAVIITKPVDELSDKLSGLNITLVISALLSCLIMVIPAYIAGRKLTNPIRSIQSVAQSMSVGDFSKRADENQAGEIGELAVAINEFAEKSEKLEQTRRDYVANISHELRTPIASIRAMSETLHDGLVTDEEKKQRYYDHILRESMRLTRLVDDLLELSRLQSRGIALKCENTDLLPVLDASAATFEQTAEDSGVDFKFLRPESLPTAFTNADRIQQILVILIDNAIKHTPDDGTVTLSVDVEPRLLKIHVTDTGEGISPDDLPHVFERFYKSDKSRSGNGTGLGLSIAREVLAMMDESISVKSQPGKGSVFTFTVHLAKQ